MASLPIRVGRSSLYSIVKVILYAFRASGPNLGFLKDHILIENVIYGMD